MAAWYRRYAVRRCVQNKTDGSVALSVANELSYPSHSNKRNTRRSRAPPLWCSPTPEDGRWAPCFYITLPRITCTRKPCRQETSIKMLSCFMSTRPANSFESWNIKRSVKRQWPPLLHTGTAPRYCSNENVTGTSESGLFTSPLCQPAFDAGFMLKNTNALEVVIPPCAAFLSNGPAVLQKIHSLTKLSLILLLPSPFKSRSFCWSHNCQPLSSLPHCSLSLCSLFLLTPSTCLA